MSQGGEPPCTRHALPTSRAGLRVVLKGEKESRPPLALAFALGRVGLLTATLPFACGSDGGSSFIGVTYVAETALYQQNGVPA